MLRETEIKKSLKRYASAPKYRCVLRDIFYRERLAEIYRRRVLRPAGVSEESIERFMRRRTDFRLRLERDLIKFNIDSVFESRTEYYPGRFNTRTFSAFYTAKEKETALAEKRYYAGGGGAQAVVFCVEFTGHAFDLRPLVIRKRVDFNKDHGRGQAIAIKVRELGLAGIAAPSWQNPSGSCCALFSGGTIDPDRVVESVAL
jgi:hypothetical protein